MNGKVSIVTRARNRLEYTVQTVAAIRNNTHYPDYEHLVINQASTDGTREWLDWIAAMPSKWYSRVRAIHLPENTGDFGGMLAALEHIADDSEYIVKHDNDILVPWGWLGSMVALLEETDAAAVMLKRVGVGASLRVSNERDFPCACRAGRVSTVHACYVCRSSVFRQFAPKVTGDGYLIAAIGKPAMKITSLTCEQIEGFRGHDLPYVQKEKYGVSEKRI
jgi:glycosyltransferase involved in cell wall biosynthesis